MRPANNKTENFQTNFDEQIVYTNKRNAEADEHSCDINDAQVLNDRTPVEANDEVSVH